MIVKCPSCAARFRVPDEKVKPQGIKVRCGRCKTVFKVRPPAADLAVTKASSSDSDALTRSISTNPGGLGTGEFGFGTGEFGFGTGEFGFGTGGAGFQTGGSSSSPATAAPRSEALRTAARPKPAEPTSAHEEKTRIGPAPKRPIETAAEQDNARSVAPPPPIAQAGIVARGSTKPRLPNQKIFGGAAARPTSPRISTPQEPLDEATRVVHDPLGGLYDDIDLSIEPTGTAPEADMGMPALRPLPTTAGPADWSLDDSIPPFAATKPKVPSLPSSADRFSDPVSGTHDLANLDEQLDRAFNISPADDSPSKPPVSPATMLGLPPLDMDESGNPVVLPPRQITRRREPAPPVAEDNASFDERPDTVTGHKIDLHFDQPGTLSPVDLPDLDDVSDGYPTSSVFDSPTDQSGFPEIADFSDDDFDDVEMVGKSINTQVTTVGPAPGPPTLETPTADTDDAGTTKAAEPGHSAITARAMAPAEAEESEVRDDEDSVDEESATDSSRGSILAEAQRFDVATRWLATAVTVLLMMIGFALFVAARNDWLLDFKQVDQMIAVAFKGHTFEPRHTRIIRIYDIDGQLIEEPVDDVAETVLPLSAANLRQSFYLTQNDVPLLLVEGDLVNSDTNPHRRIYVAGYLRRGNETIDVSTAPVGRLLAPEDLERILNPSDLEPVYDTVAEEATNLVINNDQRSVFTIVFAGVDPRQAEGLSYSVELVRADRADNDGRWRQLTFQGPQ